MSFTGSFIGGVLFSATAYHLFRVRMSSDVMLAQTVLDSSRHQLELLTPSPAPPSPLKYTGNLSNKDILSKAYSRFTAFMKRPPADVARHRWNQVVARLAESLTGRW
ncbi:hypothetical protein SeLEV6574_g07482 [Synchytrium endobioticum]|nr:hypothetical protein SeLEV6574_g07482 [Synchytrium endobioticum]